METFLGRLLTSYHIHINYREGRCCFLFDHARSLIWGLRCSNDNNLAYGMTHIGRRI